MHFELSHDFDIPLDALALAVISPSLPEKLAAKLATVETIRTKEHTLHEDRMERVLSFQANVKLPAFARGVVTREMCAWDERTKYDFRTHRAEWVVEPNIKPEWKKFFRGFGSYSLTTLADGRTRRRVEGTVELTVPYVRKVAERMLVGEVKKTFEAEAATLRELATLV